MRKNRQKNSKIKCLSFKATMRLKRNQNRKMVSLLMSKSKQREKKKMLSRSSNKKKNRLKLNDKYYFCRIM